MQSQCGASYAFSAVAAMEGANALATGKLTMLSEQNIIDCSGKHNYATLMKDFIYQYVHLSKLTSSSSIWQSWMQGRQHGHGI